MKKFEPNYNNLVESAYNRMPERLPLYEHKIAVEKMEEILDCKFAHLIGGNKKDLDTFFSLYCNFYKDFGYDTVTFEECLTPILPNAGCLSNSSNPPPIEDRESFEKYPWDKLESFYFDKNTVRFEALRRNMPEGMKAVGGVGNGIFECVQDVVGYENLCYMSVDDPELYADLFKRVGEISFRIWERFMTEFSDIYCVLRFGDDLGFRSQTLLPPQDIRTHILPCYKAIVDTVHSYNKPFLLHSCGKIFGVMDDIIDYVGVDAKHSNEDQIAPFTNWIEEYGERIGFFGGIDTDAVCRLEENEMEIYILDVLTKCSQKGGFAFGSGNSIPGYVPAKNFCHMNKVVREFRGE